MPYHKSSIKRMRTTEKRNERNRAARSRMRTSVKGILSLTSKEGAVAKLKETISVIDKSVKAGIIHKNNAANKKSQLAKFVNKLA